MPSLLVSMAMVLSQPAACHILKWPASGICQTPPLFGTAAGAPGSPEQCVRRGLHYSSLQPGECRTWWIRIAVETVAQAGEAKF